MLEIIKVVNAEDLERILVIQGEMFVLPLFSPIAVYFSLSDMFDLLMCSFDVSHSTNDALETFNRDSEDLYLRQSSTLARRTQQLKDLKGDLENITRRIRYVRPMSLSCC